MKELTLNEKIALILHKGSKLQLVPLSDISGQTMTCLNNSCRPILDYTGNWNDLMPLVVENCDFIKILKSPNLTHVVMDGKQSANKNPQRALAECLLKVLQGEQANEL